MTSSFIEYNPDILYFETISGCQLEKLKGAALARRQPLISLL
jgi:hypothetical protein